MASLGSRMRSRKRHPVFLDERHRRGHRLKIASGLAGFALFAWLASVALGIYLVEILPESARLDEIRLGAVARNPDADTEAPPPPSCPAGIGSAPDRPGAAVVVHLRSLSDIETTTLPRGCDVIDRFLVEALVIAPETGAVQWSDWGWPEVARRELAGKAPGAGIELVATLPMPAGALTSGGVLDDTTQRAALVEELGHRVTEVGAVGLCLNPRRVGFGQLDALTLLLSDLRAVLPDTVTTCLVADADGPLWRDAAMIDTVDSLVLRAFRDPATDPVPAPGPLAPQDWFERLVEDAVTAVGPEKLRVSLGAFGYLWAEGQAEPRPVSYVEAMELAARHDAAIAVDATALNTRITYRTAEGQAAELWLLDAVSLYNQSLALSRRGVPNRVLWSVGLEDPAAWLLLARPVQPGLPALVETVSYPDVVRYAGSGPFRKVVQHAAAGRRSFLRDPATGLLSAMTYAALPRPFTVERYGALKGRHVALTFDDGPDRPYTARILDVLRQEQVPATFFVIGANVVQHPDLVRRMLDEGHEIGSHTFFHPGNERGSAERLRLELNALQRLLAGVTGRATFLFRAPYGRSEGPMTRSEAVEHMVFEQAGLLVAGADIVPRDWEGMTADEIVAYVMETMTGDDGQVIVLHDAGGDRAATAEAVPLLIQRLRAEGYDFAPLSSFIGLTPDEVMPLATDLLTPFDRAWYLTLATAGQVLLWVFWGAIALGVARSLVVLGLALARRRHPSTPREAPVSVAVLIPAFNEELVIGDAIRAALASDYPGLAVIVIDDGSTDDTAAVVQRDFGTDPRVRLIRQPNGGKWSALNTAYAEIDAEVVVAVDADTILEPDAVRLLAGHFADPKVGAVAGIVKVGNRHGLLPRLQALEYITAQNIDRRAAERLNAMLVVPGSIGAWRVEAVRKVGLYSPETITEDADLTVAVIRAGYRVVFEERAVSITNGVESLRAFMRQRLRWSFGMMQTAWKHRRAARTAKGVGLFAIPDLWIIGVLLGLIAPLVDAIVLGALVKSGIALAQGQPLQPGDASVWLIAGWLALPLLDLLVTLVAFGFDRREQVSLILLAPFQRLIYRPLLYVTIYRAVGHALAGHIAGWGKLIRLGRVEKPVS